MEQERQVDQDWFPVFLEDLPLSRQAEEDARFGHGGVAEALRTVVEKCPTPFTIALYGKWGTGKSTVVSLLCDALSDQTPAILIDVWKYQDDTLRRVVLKEMDRQGRELPTDGVFDSANFNLDEHVELETSLATEFKLGLVLKQLRDSAIAKWWERQSTGAKWAWGVGAVVLMLLAIALTLMFPLQIAPVISAVVAGVAAALAVLEAVSVLLTPKTRTLTQGRYSDPYEFQQEFERILEEGFVGATRVLVVFDNIDRVQPDKALEVLSTIKTFLESRPQDHPSKTVFLVPCDDDAIRRHLKERYADQQPAGVKTDTGVDAKGEEFLRKFFNTSLRLPDFVGSELADYCSSLLRRTKAVPLDDDRISWLIAKAFRDNPRQVKQFVNVLLAQYVLLLGRSNGTELPEGFAQENAAQLALFLLLQSLFPEQMRVLSGNGTMKADPADTALDPALAKFVGQVQGEVTITDLQVWFKLRRSEQEQSLPGLNDFLLNLQDGETDKAEAFLQEVVGSDEKMHNLNLAIRERLPTVKNPVAFLTAVDTLFGMLEGRALRLETTTYADLSFRIKGDFGAQQAAAVARLRPVPVANQLLAAQRRDKQTYVNHWVAYLEALQQAGATPRAAFMLDLMKVIGAHPDWFASSSEKVQPALLQHVSRDATLLGALLDAGGGVWVSEAMAVQFVNTLGEV